MTAGQREHCIFVLVGSDDVEDRLSLRSDPTTLISDRWGCRVGRLSVRRGIGPRGGDLLPPCAPVLGACKGDNNNLFDKKDLLDQFTYFSPISLL